ncbi:hypothetical protein JCM15519_06680 [Fundidesulfovibrio butyratiphilus]
MPRPRKRRCIQALPPALFYKPQGVALADLRGVTLPLDGYEAMRLVDALGLSQEEAAQRMGVSRPTLCRVLAEARCVVARAISNGWAIRVETEEDAIETVPTRNGRGPGRRGQGGRGQGRANRNETGQAPKEETS